jgi:hypothetical protein
MTWVRRSCSSRGVLLELVGERASLRRGGRQQVGEIGRAEHLLGRDAALGSDSTSKCAKA